MKKPHQINIRAAHLRRSSLPNRFSGFGGRCLLPALLVLFVWPGGAHSVELIRTSQRQFAIPFKIETGGAGDPVRTVELLCSADFGTTWKIAGQATPEVGKIEFRASRDGEYWFAFRTTGESGQVKQPEPVTAQIRVAVGNSPGQLTGNSETDRPKTAAKHADQVLPGSPPTPRRNGPVLPPKPTRMNAKSVPAPRADSPQSGSELRITTDPSASVYSIDSANPTNPTVKNVEPERDAVEPPPLAALFAEVGEIYANRSPLAEPEPLVPPPVAPSPTSSPVSDVGREAASVRTETVPPPSPFKTVPIQPHLTFEPGDAATEKEVANSASPAPPPTPVEGVAAFSKSPLPPGRITKIELQAEQGKKTVVVRWVVSPPVPQSSGTQTPSIPTTTATVRADLLRGSTVEGPWEPIVVGLENTGEYWWYVSAVDFKPFYVAVRTQATDGRFTFDTTRSPIKIDATMLGK